MIAFNGYLCLGTGNATFVEQTAASYARQPITLINQSATRTTNAQNQTFTATDSTWATVSQFALATSLTAPPLAFWTKPIPEGFPNGHVLTLPALASNLFLNVSFYATGTIAMFVAGGVIGHDNAGNNLTALAPFIVTDGSIVSTGSLPGLGTRIGNLLGANLNVTTDQQFTMLGLGVGNYIVRQIIATNASTAPGAMGGIYTTSSKGGTYPLVPATQAFSTLTNPFDYVSLAIAAITQTTVYFAPPYLSLTTPHGAPCTADFHIFGEVLA